MIEKKFISPTGPIPEIASKWFVDTFAEKLTQTPVSFSDILVLVPTRAAAKNLRDAILSECFAREVYGVCELNIKTLEDELAEYQKQTNTITATEARATWISTFDAINLNNLTGLFPYTTPSRNDHFHLAKELEFLQNTLAENLESIASTSDKLFDSPDAQRWQDLKSLEITFEEKVNQSGKLTRLQSLIEAIEHSTKLSKCKHVAVVGNPDASPLLKRYLKYLNPDETRISIVIFSDRKDVFDIYGTPITEMYSEAELEINDSEINIYANVKKQAQAIANLAQAYADKVYDTIAISCDQKKSIDIFKDELAKKDINAISLEAESLEKTEVFDLISNLFSYCQFPNFRNFLNLVHNPIYLKKLEKISNHTADEILANLDFIAQESICADVSQANSTLYARLNARDFQTDRMRKELLQVKYIYSIFEFAQQCSKIESNASNILDFISDILPDDLEDNNKLVHSVLCECVENICDAENFAQIKFNRDEIFSIIIDYIRSTTTKIELEDKRIPLQDWMEIFWSPKPHLLLCDMNDGIVPLANSDGLFLNDSIRKKLGMRHQALRQARDAYMLETLKLSRRVGGAITICVPKQNISADPLMPSRILFQAHNLPKRTQLLFQEPEISDVQQHYTPEWNLDVPTLKYEKNYYSATHLNKYMKSPWEFYLQYVLSMKIVNSLNEEMDAMQFGTIFHKTMYRFAMSEIKDSTDENEILDFLLKEFEAIERDTFGISPRAQVRIQLENLKNRILSCAKVQAEHRANGWRIKCAEKSFKIDLCDRTFIGTFDRIDVNEKTNLHLVLDYKTYDIFHPGITKEKHLHITRNETRWMDLQLPLYVCAANKIFETNDVTCGYFIAPKNTKSTSIDIWKDVAEYQESAIEKMKEIISDIEAGKFELSEANQCADYESIFNMNFDSLKEVLKFKK